MNQLDFYSTLGVDRRDSMGEIRRVYHRLVRQYHPDLNCGHPAPDATIGIINTTETLCDPAKQVQHDRSLGCFQGGTQRDGSSVTWSGDQFTGRVRRLLKTIGLPDILIE